MLDEKSNRFLIFLFWVLATAIGWLAGVFNLNTSVKTYMDIIRWLPIYLADGLLIGLIAGIGQALVLRKFTNSISAWILATVLGYGLTFLGGLIVSVLIPSLVWLSQGSYVLPFATPSTVSMRLSVDDLFAGGIFLGLLQWPVLKGILPGPNRKKGILWVLATWFALGTNMFVAGFMHRSPLAVQMGITGIVVGTITGWVLLALLPALQTGEQFSN